MKVRVVCRMGKGWQHRMEEYGLGSGRREMNAACVEDV